MLIGVQGDTTARVLMVSTSFRVRATPVSPNGVFCLDRSKADGRARNTAYLNYFNLNAATTGLNTASVFIGGILANLGEFGGIRSTVHSSRVPSE